MLKKISCKTYELIVLLFNEQSGRNEQAKSNENCTYDLKLSLYSFSGKVKLIN